MTTMMCSRVLGRAIRVAAGAGVLSLAVAGSVMAQTPTPNDPNPGALTFTGNLDVPAVYVFRGIVQERDPKLTLFPSGDIGIALKSGEGGLKSVAVNFGSWHSLQTGSSGSNGPSDRLHYEEDFYATLSLGFNHGIGFATTYTSYTSPNGMFNTVKEIMFKVSKTHMIAPYAIVAFELDKNGQADGGSKKGTYMELGVGPSWPLAKGKLTLTVPVKLGLSLKDYYEGPTGDSKFGYLDVGGLLALPLTKVPSQFGTWNVHVGVDVYAFGDTTKAFNNGNGGRAVPYAGIGITY
jgi:hypothetical protein